jgi:pimeloyl-ACP methyl ester carboxylesterase
VTTPDGRTITVREGGDPAGVPVLIHNGTPASSLLYEPHLEDAAERGIRLFSYDRPGYGASTRLPGRRAADCAVDVAAVCDALGIERLCVWGASGGGPHALATAALLPDRVAAAVSIASIAPLDAEGLDFTAGMGELNAHGFEMIQQGEESHRVQHELEVASLRDATPEGLIEAWRTILGPADLELLSTDLAEFGIESINAGMTEGTDGWFDDDLVFVDPWGFDLASIRVPTLVVHGEQDRFVPFSHGVWLAEHIPGAEAWLTAEDGHLTLAFGAIGRVHEWLLARF